MKFTGIWLDGWNNAQFSIGGITIIDKILNYFMIASRVLGGVA
jgi:hypothetical protein